MVKQKLWKKKKYLATYDIKEVLFRGYRTK